MVQADNADNSRDELNAALTELVRSPEMTRIVIDRLQQVPQLPCNVRHIFGPWVYMREISAAAGAVIFGRSHRSAHNCIVARGALTFFNADGTLRQMKARCEFRASAGRLVAHVDEDMVFVITYETAERDMDALEEEIFAEPAPMQPLQMLAPDGDYEAMLAELGAAAAAMKAISERTDDLCVFPDGVYKCKVGRSRIEGKGLIATADIETGECIAVATWEGKRTPAARYSNHAKQPNACFGYSTNGTALLLALHPIAGNRGGLDGEEITVDYRCTLRDRREQLS
jgi:hypothetical protein